MSQTAVKMRFICVLLVAFVVIWMVDCRPQSDKDVRALKLKPHKGNLKKTEEKTQDKHIFGDLNNGVTFQTGSLTSTVTGLLASLDLTNLGLDVLLGGVFDVVSVLKRWPSVLFELLNLKEACMAADKLFSALTGLTGQRTFSTVLSVVCPVVVGVVEKIARSGADLINDILDQLEDLLPLLQCLNINILLAQVSVNVAVLATGAPTVKTVSSLGLCDQLFGDPISQAKLLRSLLNDALGLVGFAESSIPGARLGGLLG